MKREIKFRAWDGKYKEMVNDIHIAPEYDWLVLSDNDALAERDNRGRKNGEKYILMQYTGLKDKNGKEIYEGDVVALCVPQTIGDATSVGGAIEWNRDGWWQIDIPDEGQSIGIQVLHDEQSEIEIIGNIYENPELLEGK